MKIDNIVISKFDERMLSPFTSFIASLQPRSYQVLYPMFGVFRRPLSRATTIQMNENNTRCFIVGRRSRKNKKEIKFFFYFQSRVTESEMI